MERMKRCQQKPAELPEQMGLAHERQLLATIAEVQPAAWVLIDEQPFASHSAAQLDLSRSRPELALALSMYYAEVRRYGGVHVFRRRRDVRPVDELEPQ
jgi:hypothetical protein